MRLQRKNRKTKWLEQLRGCLLCLLLGECSFDRRDFPKTGEQSAVRSAVQQGKGALSRPTEDGKEGALLNLPRFFGRFYRVLLGAALLMGTAQCRQRTQQTARRGGQTDGGSQFHQRLVKVAGAVLRHNRKQQLAERLFGLRQTDVIAAAQDAGNYPQDVAVHSGHGDTKGDGGDGSGGVVTDAGQSSQLSVVGGKLSAVLFDQQAGGFLQIARAAVIAKTFPQLEQPVFGTGCKRLDGGQLGKKALEVGLDCFYPGLLEHDLRYPHAVGRGLVPPGKGTFILLIPKQKRLNDLREPLLRVGRDHRCPPSVSCSFRKDLMWSKVSSLMICSMRQASAAAVSAEIPRTSSKKRQRMQWRS